jgi:hypothetical protein
MSTPHQLGYQGRKSSEDRQTPFPDDHPVEAKDATLDSEAKFMCPTQGPEENTNEVS